MTIKNLLFCCALALFAGFASAALPPYTQRANEIITLLQDSRVYDAFGGPAITSVISNDAGYLLIADKCRLQVAIRYLPFPDDVPPGPSRFEFDVPERAVCS